MGLIGHRDVCQPVATFCGGGNLSSGFLQQGLRGRGWDPSRPEFVERTQKAIDQTYCCRSKKTEEEKPARPEPLHKTFPVWVQMI